MMNSKKSRTRAFSLVELVIVVVIIGVIAAIAVPRISRGAKGAGDAALRASLAGIRNAIDMYAAEHLGNYPGLFPVTADQAALETQLTTKTDANGGAGGDFGPYLRSGFPTIPVGSVKGQSDVKFPLTAAGDPVADGTTAWAYSTDTGKFIANTAVGDIDEKGVKYSDY
ncbi:MAG: prepilin-type N-terminal cleavage/methylation domain-containing protein [Planctomycetota bacterium]|jgi:prepilin-type N-terminal cleavage/methylation domain-containing protein